MTQGQFFKWSFFKLATVVEGDPKAPFSIATTPTCRGGRYSILWFAPLHPWSSPYNVECLARRYQVPFFESLVWLDLGLNPSLPDHWRTLYPLVQWPEEPSLHYYLTIAGGRTIGFTPFPRVWVQCENAVSLIQDLNLCRRVHFLWR